MDPHFFADQDPESQNNADPADPDPDPKHCSKRFDQLEDAQNNLLSPYQE